MAKRVSFYPVVQEKGNGDEEPLPKKSKHSLDSDDESDDEGNENYNIMDPDEFEGQEEGEIRREQDVTITPFNMNEELEEGHIDRDGMYIFKKEADQVTDHWLANIDSVQLKEPVPRKSSHESDAIKLSTNDCYRKMIDLVLPGETVKRAIQRLGRKGKKTFGAKNKKNLSETEVLEQENERAKMLELISVADQVLDAGDMDIYERTFEQLNFRLKQAEELSKGTDDMFAEPEDEKPETQVSTESVVTWLLKWEDKEDTEIHGPFTNDQMIQWCSSGYFDKVADASAGTHKYDVINVKSSHNEIGASVITIVYLLIGIIRQLFSWRQYNGVGQYYCHLAILTAILLVLSVLTVIFGPSIFGVLALIFNLAYFVLITMMYNNVY